MDLDDLLVQLDARKAEIAGLLPLKPEVEQRLREKFRLDWNFHSTALEGNSLTFEETKSLLLEGLMPKGGKLIRHADDIRGHDQARQFLEELIAARAPLDDRVLSRMHALLLREGNDTEALTGDGKTITRRVVPGRYRTTASFARLLGGGVREYPAPAEIERQVAELLRWHGEQEASPSGHPVVHAATLHHRFLAIHPFDDGNGRLARLLMNFVLMRHGLPPVIIKKEDRRTYRGALQGADAGDNVEWLSFIARNLLEALAVQARGARGESIEESNDVDQALRRLKRELDGVEEPQELSQERFTRILTGSIGPLVIRLLEKVRQFDELYSAEKLSIACQVFTDAAFTAPAPGPSLSARKIHAKKWLADFPASIVMSELAVTMSWDGFRKGGLNDFSTSLTVRFSFEKRKYHIHCEPIQYSRRLLHQQRLPEEETRRFLDDVARHLLGQIQHELEPQTQ